MDKDTNQKIKDELKNNDVCLFMKGTPDVPQCGFSLAIANVLKHLEVKFRGIDAGSAYLEIEADTLLNENILRLNSTLKTNKFLDLFYKIP